MLMQIVCFYGGRKPITQQSLFLAYTKALNLDLFTKGFAPTPAIKIDQ
jgi:hypothetical protein